MATLNRTYAPSDLRPATAVGERVVRRYQTYKGAPIGTVEAVNLNGPGSLSVRMDDDNALWSGTPGAFHVIPRTIHTVEVETENGPVIPSSTHTECTTGNPCTCAWKSATAQAAMATAILAGTSEPQPARALHDMTESRYTTSGHSETFGAWSVVHTVTDV